MHSVIISLIISMKTNLMLLILETSIGIFIIVIPRYYKNLLVNQIKAIKFFKYTSFKSAIENFFCLSKSMVSKTFILKFSRFTINLLKRSVKCHAFIADKKLSILINNILGYKSKFNSKLIKFSHVIKYEILKNQSQKNIQKSNMLIQKALYTEFLFKNNSLNYHADYSIIISSLIKMITNQKYITVHFIKTIFSNLPKNLKSYYSIKLGLLQFLQHVILVNKNVYYKTIDISNRLFNTISFT